MAGGAGVTHHTLTQILEEMERTDPYLRELVEKEERQRWRTAFWARIDARRAAEGKPPLRGRA